MAEFLSQEEISDLLDVVDNDELSKVLKSMDDKKLNSKVLIVELEVTVRDEEEQQKLVMDMLTRYNCKLSIKKESNVRRE